MAEYFSFFNTIVTQEQSNAEFEQGRNTPSNTRQKKKKKKSLHCISSVCIQSIAVLQSFLMINSTSVICLRNDDDDDDKSALE